MVVVEIRLLLFSIIVLTFNVNSSVPTIFLSILPLKNRFKLQCTYNLLSFALKDEIVLLFTAFHTTCLFFFLANFLNNVSAWEKKGGGGGGRHQLHAYNKG